MVMDLLRRKKTSREEEQERRHIAGLLDLALVQRSKVHVQFDEEVTNLTGITGSIMAVNDAGIALELSGLSALPERFLNRKLECFFRIIEREERHREFFYAFSAVILRQRQRPGGLPQVIISFPGGLEETQRRKSLRLKPDLQKFSHMAFWKYNAGGSFDIAKPALGLGQLRHGQAVFENISAGGLRIVLRRALLKEQDLEPKKGDRFIVLCAFAEQLPKLRPEHWFIAKINNLRLDPVSGDATLGFEFIANGLRQPDSGKVEWTKIGDNVLDDLAQRIYHWHLALYRDKGLAGG